MMPSGWLNNIEFKATNCGFVALNFPRTSSYQGLNFPLTWKQNSYISMIHQYYHEIEILVGPDAGQKVRAQPTCKQVGHPASAGHTITVTAMKVESLNNAVFCNDPNDPDIIVYRDLYTPYDRNGVKINVGDNIIWARSAKGDGDIYTGTVVSYCNITDPNKEHQFRKINVACNEYKGHIERINNTWEVIVGTIKIP